MSTYQQLIFNKELFQHDLMLNLDKALEDAITIVLSSQKYFNGNSFEKNEVFGGFEYDIHSTDFKAWILEYGKGKYLDTSNPYLEDYKNTVYWNQKRESHNNAILYRGNGNEYTQLDYGSGNGSYTTTGKGNPDLEVPQWAQGVSPTPFIDRLFKEIWILFGTESNVVIREMENRIQDYFTVKDVVIK